MKWISSPKPTQIRAYSREVDHYGNVEFLQLLCRTNPAQLQKLRRVESAR